MPRLAHSILALGIAVATHAEETSCSVASAIAGETMRQVATCTVVPLQTSLDILELAIQSRGAASGQASPSLLMELVDRMTPIGKEAERNEHRRTRDIRVIGRMAELVLLQYQARERFVQPSAEEDAFLWQKVLDLRTQLPKPDAQIPPPSRACTLATAFDLEIQRLNASGADQPALDLQRLALLDATSRRLLEYLRTDYQAMKATPKAFGDTWKRLVGEGKISTSEQIAAGLLDEIGAKIPE